MIAWCRGVGFSVVLNRQFFPLSKLQRSRKPAFPFMLEARPSRPPLSPIRCHAVIALEALVSAALFILARVTNIALTLRQTAIKRFRRFHLLWLCQALGVFSLLLWSGGHSASLKAVTYRRENAPAVPSLVNHFSPALRAPAFQEPRVLTTGDGSNASTTTRLGTQVCAPIEKNRDISRFSGLF